MPWYREILHVYLHSNKLYMIAIAVPLMLLAAFIGGEQLAPHIAFHGPLGAAMNEPIQRWLPVFFLVLVMAGLFRSSGKLSFIYKKERKKLLGI